MFIVCKIKLTLSTLATHDCGVYFRSVIEKLETEVKVLKVENDELKATIEEFRMSQSSSGRSRRKRNGKESDAAVVARPPIVFSYEKYGDKISSPDLHRKLHRMVNIVHAFVPTSQSSEAWQDTTLHKLLTQLLDDNENAKKILSNTDLRSFYKDEFQASCFSKTFNIFNSRILIHFLLFNVLGKFSYQYPFTSLIHSSDLLLSPGNRAPDFIRF